MSQTYAEVRNTHRYGPYYEPNGCRCEDDDLLIGVAIDAYQTDDDNEQGNVVASVMLTKKGDIVVCYHDNTARSVDQVTEIIKTTREELKTEWAEYSKTHSADIEIAGDGMFYVEYRQMVSLGEQDIDAIMREALRGINAWCSDVEIVKDKKAGGLAYKQIAHGGALMLRDGCTRVTHELTIEKFLTGVKLWLEHGCDCDNAVQNGVIHTDCVNEYRADEIIQFAIFGDIEYD